MTTALSGRAIDGSAVTYEEFQRHVGKAGLTLKEFAELVRMNRVSISNLSKKGEVPSHLAVIACLLGEMAEHEVEFRTALERIDIIPKKPRGAGVADRFGGGARAGRAAPTSHRRKGLGYESGTE